MGKDFNDFLNKNNNENTQINKEFNINNIIINIFKSKILFNFFNSIFISPVYTSSINLQCSIKNLRNISLTNEELKQNHLNNKKVIENKFYQKIVNCGSTNYYYRKNNIISYKKYSEVLKSLGNEGIKGFYKGNIINNFYMTFQNIFRIYTILQIQNSDYSSSIISKFFLTYTSLTLFDFFLHPFFVLNSRFVIQNTENKTYKTYCNFFKKTWKNKEFLNGILVNAYINFNVTSCSMFSTDNDKTTLLYFLMNIINYPFYTVMRRLACTSSHMSMIPENYYKGIKDCFIMIFKEEGLKGFFRGFLGNQLAISVWPYLILYSSNNSRN